MAFIPRVENQLNYLVGLLTSKKEQIIEAINIILREYHRPHWKVTNCEPVRKLILGTELDYDEDDEYIKKIESE